MPQAEEELERVVGEEAAYNTLLSLFSCAVQPWISARKQANWLATGVMHCFHSADVGQSKL